MNERQMKYETEIVNETMLDRVRKEEIRETIESA
jgi:hypothetical protein